jgi:hypothetical protein
MKFKVDLNLSWKSLLLSSKDFIALTEIMDRSKVVDECYSEKSGHYLIEHQRQKLRSEEETREPISRAAFDAIVAKEKTEMEAENAVTV